jgi:hypothetical protein
MKYILLFLALYLAFQFIFRLVIPLFMAGRQLRKGFKQMQEQMQEQMKAQQGQSSFQGPHERSKGPAGFEAGSNRTQSTGKTAPQKEDYIDFEEIKEG